MRKSFKTLSASIRALGVKRPLMIIGCTLLVSLGFACVAFFCGHAVRPIFFFAFFMLCGISFVVVLIRERKPPQWLFATIALTLGTGMIAAFPCSSLNSWDDETHYDRALKLSYICNPETTSSDRAIINPLLISEGFSITTSFGRESTGMAAIWSEGDIAKFEAELNSNASVETLQTTEGIPTDVATVVAVGYIPSAIGLWLGRLMHLPFVWYFALGRFFNLFAYVAFIFFAIKVAPFKKALIAILGLLPTSIFLACNYSYDPWVIGATLLGVALFLRAMEGTCKNDLAYFVGGVVTLTCGFFAKAVYFPILGVALVVLFRKKTLSKRRFKQLLLLALVACLVLMMSFVLPLIIAVPGDVGDTRGGADVNSYDQIKYVFSNPLGYLWTLAHFLIANYLPVGNQEGAMTNLAYLGSMNALYPWLGGLMTVYLFAAAAFDSGEGKFFIKRSERLWVVFLLAVTLALIATALYVSFTPVGLDTIYGVQPRYCLPLYFLFFGLVCSVRCKLSIKNQKFGNTTLCLSGMILAFSIWSLLVSRIVV